MHTKQCLVPPGTPGVCVHVSIILVYIVWMVNSPALPRLRVPLVFRWSILLMCKQKLQLCVPCVWVCVCVSALQLNNCFWPVNTFQFWLNPSCARLFPLRIFFFFYSFFRCLCSLPLSRHLVQTHTHCGVPRFRAPFKERLIDISE